MYKARPKSFIGFIWRLHTKICPGWKKYQRWLAEKEAGQKAAKNCYVVVSLLI
ncbi:MAG: hypothetical protein KAT18_02580 [Candidatus Latescibacteria bacterium]|nr:hypothetical protein [Candidatus Latescibacterota bacterium]